MSELNLFTDLRYNYDNSAYINSIYDRNIVKITSLINDIVLKYGNR